ncbi:spermidine synthase [Haloglomus litoreum]|uniref:spermidine synthase n=1 Tax=Haloglomus litoreum TaxID=3034026 RepID=UPI0023E75EC6|nr:fused MFS/spermidine synthase [Haloglomus sp. DT116]
MSTLRGRLPTVTEPGVAVFVSGVASMGLEILSGRIVAPQFGSSIYTWGTIIGVFLAALSLGYHRGGQRAAEHASTERMAWALVATAAYVAAIVFAGDLMLAAVTGLPLPARFASLPAVTLLFGPPTYLLGYISPYAAELAEADGVGRASGHVYAVGTVGSILGAFGTTFLLIPSLSVEYIGLVFGLLLVGTAVYLTYPPVSGLTARSLGVGVLLVLAATSGSFGFGVEGRVLYETQTAYQELEVGEINGTRTLYLDDQRHSAMDVDRPTRHVFEYTRYFHLPYLLADDPDDIDRVLFVGGGGFTGPKRFLEEYDATVDVVEIDPEVVRVAKEYFAVNESHPRLNIYREDGRRYLRETDRTYDLIVLDAYKKDKVPFQLTTVEFFELARSRLSADGMLYANVISAETGPASKFYRAEYRTMSEVFPQVYTFPTVGGSLVGNIQVVATRNGTRLDRETLLERNGRRDIGIDLSAEVRTLRDEPPRTDDVPVLRDDRAPVDSLLDPMVGQRYVVQTAQNGTATPARALDPGAGSPTTVPRNARAVRVSGV